MAAKKKAKKKVVKKKATKKKVAAKEPEKTEISLHNVFPYLVAEMAAQSNSIKDLHLKIDRLQLTVDAVGVKVADLGIEL